MDQNILQNKVFINAEQHKYYDDQGNEYTSVTRLLKQFSQDADFQMIARAVAKKRNRVLGEMADSQKTTLKAIQKTRPLFQRGITQTQVLSEWDAKRDRASDIGSYIHHQLELAGTTNTHNRNCKYINYYDWFIENHSQYKGFYEQIVYLEEPRIAGTIDFCYYRTSSRGMVNIRDFKTNNYKLDSTLIDEYTGEVKNYNRYLSEPLTHLEDCDFTKYVLQQSIYMYMLEVTIGLKPGNLGVIRMPWEKKLETPETHIMPYMRAEVIQMVEYVKNHFKAEKTNFEEDTEGNPEYHDFIKI
jgi:hypothetical protein